MGELKLPSSLFKIPTVVCIYNLVHPHVVILDCMDTRCWNASRRSTGRARTNTGLFTDWLISSSACCKANHINYIGSLLHYLFETFGLYTVPPTVPAMVTGRQKIGEIVKRLVAMQLPKVAWLNEGLTFYMGSCIEPTKKQRHKIKTHIHAKHKYI